MNFEGTYFDGKSSKPLSVSITIQNQGILLSFKDGSILLWDLDTVKKFEKQGGKLMLFYGDDVPYATLESESLGLLEELERRAPGYPFLKDEHRFFEKHKRWSYLSALMIIVGFLAIGNFFILPILAKTAAENLPVSLEQELGENVFNTFISMSEIDSSKTEVLREFGSSIDFDTHYDLELYVINSNVVNAFALPGGKIVVFTGILDKMESYEELAALLGHEAGHVVHRHSLISLVQQYSHLYMISLLTGNSNQMIKVISSTASNLSMLSNSRDAEREADKYGMFVLNLNKIDPDGIVQLFKKLHEHSGNLEVPDLLSSHPNTKERISSMRADIAIGSEVDFQENNYLKQLFDELKGEGEMPTDHLDDF